MVREDVPSEKVDLMSMGFAPAKTQGCMTWFAQSDWGRLDFRGGLQSLGRSQEGWGF